MGAYSREYGRYAVSTLLVVHFPVLCVSDIAVGAPYQRHSDQANGTVFIYYGDAVNTLDTIPGQVCA